MQNIRIVSRGVDTLVLNGYYTGPTGKPIKRDIDVRLSTRLTEWKRMAQEQHEECATSLTFNGSSLHMCPNGAGQGQWPWMLKTPDVTLYISNGHWNGVTSARLSAQYLWSCQGLHVALAAVQALFDEIFQERLFLQLSAVDLCADVAGWDDLDRLDKHQNFVSRARKRVSYAEPDWGFDYQLQDYSLGLQQTGLHFGGDKRASSPLSCAIYDKTREVLQSGKVWFYDLWRLNGWNEEQGGAVQRTEFRFKRESLHTLQQKVGQAEIFHGIEDAYTLPERIPVLWAYAAGRVGGGADGFPDGWLRCACSNGDTNRSRWPTHPAWEVIQTAFSDPTQIPTDFGKIIRKRWEDHNIDRGIEAVMGYLSSLAAWSGGPLAEEGTDLSMVLHWLHEHGQAYLERVDRDFSAEILRKRVKLGKHIASQ